MPFSVSQRPGYRPHPRSLGKFTFQRYVVEPAQEGPVTPGLLPATAPAAFHEGFAECLAYGPNGLSGVRLATYVLDEHGAAIRERLHRHEHVTGPAPVSWRAIEEA